MEFDSSDNWQSNADCLGKDLGLFFESYETSSEVAKDVDELCAGCPVQMKCLRMGVLTAGTGVHGGIYLALGKVSKARNSHKSPDQLEAATKLVKILKENE